MPGLPLAAFFAVCRLFIAGVCIAVWAVAGGRADASPTASAPGRRATRQDLRARADWVSRAGQTPPFSFTVGGKSAADLLSH